MLETIETTQNTINLLKCIDCSMYVFLFVSITFVGQQLKDVIKCSKHQSLKIIMSLTIFYIFLTEHKM